MSRRIPIGKVNEPQSSIITPAFDYTEIVKAAISAQAATAHIPAMVKAEIEKGWRQLPNTEPNRSPKSWFFDPLSLQYSLGYKDRRYSITYDTLKRISQQLSIVSAIINTRSAQVAAFSQPYRWTKSLGFIIRHKDPDHSTTPAEIAFIKELEQFILNCGRAEKNPYSRIPRDDFETFLRKIVRDSLTFDQICCEVVPDRIGLPFEFVAVDASTIRYASEDRYTGINSSYTSREGFVPSVPARFAGLYEGRQYGTRTADGERVQYVQIINGQIENIYGTGDLAFGVRNPRTDIYIQGYGYGELEQLITIVTSHLNAEQYTSRFFTANSTPKGILNMKGDNWTPEQLEAFRRQWGAMVSGIENSWKMPVLQSEGIEFIDMHKGNEEMGFGKWLEYLIKISCFPPGTNISMADGTQKAIETIKPGEKVLTHTGRAQEVLNTQQKHFDGKLVCIRAGNKTIKATPEHPFWVASPEMRSNNTYDFDNAEFSWVKAEDLVEGEHFLLIPKNRDQDTITSPRIDLSEYVEDLAVTETTVQLCNSGRYNNSVGNAKLMPRYIEIDDANAFILGLYVAEGSSTDGCATFSLHQNEEYLKKIIYAFADRMRVTSSEYKKLDNASCNINISSSVLARTFVQLCGDGALNKKVPSVILSSPLHIQRSFLSGLLSGDGCADNDNCTIRLRLTTSSDVLAQQYTHMMLTQGVHVHDYLNTYSKMSDNPSHDLTSFGRFAKSASEWLKGIPGDDLRKFFAEKTGKFRSQVRDSESYVIVPISEISRKKYIGSVFNIEVNKEHSYQVERFGVHNCGVFLIDPAELNFDMHGGVQQTPLFESSQEWKLKASRDRGLKPLLRFIAKLINKHIIDRIDDHFTLEFVGLDEMSEQEKHELIVQQIASYMTLNEARRTLDLPDLPNGDIPMNPVYISALQSQQQAAGGAPGEEAATADTGSSEETPDEGLSPSEPQYTSHWGLQTTQGIHNK